MSRLQIASHRRLLAAVLLVTMALSASSCALYEDVEPLDQSLAVNDLEITPDPVRIELNQTTQVSAVLYDKAGKTLDGIEVSWTSGNSSIATVDADGVVEGLAVGDTTITAKVGETTATATVVVYTPVSRIEIEPSSAVVDVGANKQLTATVYGESDDVLNGRQVQWSSSDEAVVTVDEEGQITGVAEGQATIRAKATGVTGTAEVQVFKPVDRVELDTEQATIEVTDTLQLTATVYDVDDQPRDDRPVSWTSSKPQVASVDETGLVEGLSEGTTTIVAASGGKRAEATITVEAPVDAVTVTPNPATVGVGSTMQMQADLTDAAGNELSGRDVSWQSSDEAIATVDANGLVSGVAGGQVTITATSEGVDGTASVEVADPVATVDVSPDPLTLAVLETHQMSATLKDAGGHTLTNRPITWRSEDTAIATVDASGIVTAKDAGVVNITATAEGVTGSAQVTVENVVASVEVTPANPTIEVTDTLQLTAIAKNSRGAVVSGRSVTWTSSNPSVVQVDGSGLIEGLEGGTATITAQVDNVTGTAQVTVDNPVRTVELSPASTSVEVTHTAQLTAVLKDKGGNVVTGRTINWTSSASSIASVDANGQVTGQQGGTATITAEADGATGTADITVTAPVRALVVTPNPTTVDVGSTRQLSAEPQDAAGNALSGLTVTWSSADTNIATVNSTAATTADLSGQTSGTTSVTASVDDGAGHTASANVAVTVGATVATVELTPTSVVLFPTDQAQINVTVRDANGNALTGRTVSWTSQDPATASVDNSGLITAAAVGSTTVTATCEGVSSDVTVDVVQWSQVSAGQFYSCGVLSNGDAYCWGQNNVDGILGNGTTDSGADNQNLNHDADVSSPTAVSGSVAFASVSTGIFHTCGLTASGQAYCWGSGGAGHLGSGQFVGSSTPVAVSGAYTFDDIQLGANHTCALDTSMDLYCWGYNSDGQLGQGAGASQAYAIPQRISGHKFVALAVGANHTCGISQAGPTYCWGDGTLGQLGDGSGTSSDQPVQVSTSQSFERIASGYDHTCALNFAGEMYCWGQNNYSQLGNGNTTAQNSPVRADSAHTYVDLFAGAGTTCGIDANGDVYCWGFNGQGNLGNGSTANSEVSRVLVSGGYHWTEFSLGLQHSCGLASGQTGAYCWGDNDFGQVGNGTTQNLLPAPTQVVNP